MIDPAVRLDDLRSPSGNRHETLRGDRRSQHTVRVNDQWRICFAWRAGEAWDIKLTNFHSGSASTTVNRKDSNRRAFDFSGVGTERRLLPVHPGEIPRDESLRPLGRYFGTTPEFWIKLQSRHDLDVAERRIRLEIERETEPDATNTDLVSTGYA